MVVLADGVVLSILVHFTLLEVDPIVSQKNPTHAKIPSIPILRQKVDPEDETIDCLGNDRVHGKLLSTDLEVYLALTL